MSILEFTLIVFIVSLAVQFTRTLLNKFGIFEDIQINSEHEFLVEWARCGFCQSFWIGVIITLPLAIFVHWSLLLVPICSAVLRYDD